MAHSHVPPVASLGDPPARRADTRRRMLIALAINVVLLAAEAVGGILTGSLALLADAGHVLSDVGAILLALAAVQIAGRRGGPRRTFGLQRVEVMAGFANGVALIVIAVLIVVEAVRRLSEPVDLDATPVLVIGFAGLAGNVLAAWILAGGQRADINLEGVLRHHVADALGSVGVIVSAALVLTLDFAAADPLASLLIAILIVVSSWRLISEPLDVFMEAAPRELDVERLGRDICELEDVRAVHELHVWTITAGMVALAAHVVVRTGADRDLIRRRLELLLRERYSIAHTTLQMEEQGDEGLIQLEDA